MADSVRTVVLLCAAAAFVAFILLKRALPLPALRPEARAARARLSEAKRRAASGSASPTERAAALREAATIALDSLRDPGLAAALARRAERFDPENPESFGLLANSLRRASRYRALERMLWRKLTSTTPGGAVCRASLDELVALYQGPLARPEIAAALGRMQLSPEPRVAG